jgi:hypothetical protein
VLHKEWKKYERTICRKSSKTVKIHSNLEYKNVLLVFNEKELNTVYT